MKARYVKQGAGRYVVGNVTPFDQKNEMFCRPLWDEAQLELGKKFYMTEVPPKNKPGYELKGQAMVNASWHLENIFAQGVAGGRMGMYAWMDNVCGYGKQRHPDRFWQTKQRQQFSIVGEI